MALLPTSAPPNTPPAAPQGAPGASGIPSALMSGAAAGGNPLAQLAAAKSTGAGGGNDQAMMFLAFLAGQGFEKFAGTLAKLRSPEGNRQHRGGLRMEAAQNPGMTVAPQLAQQLAQRANAVRAGMPQGMAPPPAGLA